MRSRSAARRPKPLVKQAPEVMFGDIDFSLDTVVLVEETSVTTTIEEDVVLSEEMKVEMENGGEGKEITVEGVKEEEEEEVEVESEEEENGEEVEEEEKWEENGEEVDMNEGDGEDETGEETMDEVLTTGDVVSENVDGIEEDAIGDKNLGSVGKGEGIENKGHELQKEMNFFDKSVEGALQPTKEPSSQVKTVFVEGLTRSWDEDKLKELCQQYGEIEKILVSWKLGTKKKRRDFAFVSFTSRKNADACVEGINNANISEGEAKIKANIAKPQRKSQLAKQGSRDGFKVHNDREQTEAASSKVKRKIRSRGSRGSRGKGKSGKSPFHLKSNNALEIKPLQSEGNVVERRSVGASTKAERLDFLRNEQSTRGGKHGGRSMDANNNGRPSKKSRGNARANAFGNRGSSADHQGNSDVHRGNFKNRGNNFRNKRTRYGNERQEHNRAPPRQANTFPQSYAGSGSKRSYSDMEPHAGFLKPAVVETRYPEDYGHRDEHVRHENYIRQEAYGHYELRSGTSRYDNHYNRGGVVYGGGLVLPPAYAPAYPSYAVYERGSAGSGYGYPSSGTAYPPPRQYYY